MENVDPKVSTTAVDPSASACGSPAEHCWGEWETVREPNYLVVFAAFRQCQKCPAQEWDNFCAGADKPQRTIIIPSR